MESLPDYKELYKAFSEQDFFHDFSEDEFVRLVSYGRVQKFVKNACVFEKGMASTDMYLLVSGAVKITSFSEAGKEALLNYIYPGEIVGEVGVIDGKTRTASVYCAEPCVFIAIARARLFEFLDAYPKFYKLFMLRLCDYIRWNTEVIEDAMFSDRYQRVAKKLLLMAEKQNAADGVIRLSQEELANMLGLSREIVNKSLQVLQDKGFIALRRSQIQVLDTRGLHHIIEGG